MGQLNTYNPYTAEKKNVIHHWFTRTIFKKGKLSFHWINKTFREREHPRQTQSRKCEHHLSVAISYSEPLHGKLHLVTKFQAAMWFPQFHLPGPSLSWKISKFRETRKKWPSMAILNIDLLHVTVHRRTKFQANSWNPSRARAVMSDRQTYKRRLLS